MIEKTREIKETIYEAFDGEEFKTETECLIHEARANAQKVYIILQNSTKATSTSISPDICSTLKQADKTLSMYPFSEEYHIHEVFLDIRVLIKKAKGKE